MELVERVHAMIEPSVEALGYDLVRVQFTGSRQTVLQVMAERKDGSGMQMEDCEAISRTVSALLDVEDPISHAYSLEVSSPGIDRPLTRLSDYERFAGHKAKVELKAPLEGGRRRFSGIVRGAHGENIRIELDGKVEELPFAAIAAAKLEITEALLKSAEQQQEV